MSKMYFIGTYEKNKDGFCQINKPIKITRIFASFLEDILEHSNISLKEDFSFSYKEETPKTLFYTIKKDWKGPRNEKYAEDFELGLDMYNIKDSHYPIICDGKEKNGIKVLIKPENIKKHDYSNFKKLEFNEEDLNLYIENNYFYKNNHPCWLNKELIHIYHNISRWIEENKAIYVYRM